MHNHKNFFVFFVLLITLGANYALFGKDIAINFDTELQASQVLLLQYSYNPELYTKINPQAKSNIDKMFLSLQVRATNNSTITKKRYRIQLQAGTHNVHWYPSQIGTIVSALLTVYDGIEDERDSPLLIGYKVLTKRESVAYAQGHPIATASLIDILAWNPLQPYVPEFRVFRWQAYPDVLVFSFASRAIQAKYLKRLAFFAEKTVTRGTVPHLQDIAHRKGWGAHDYKAEDLAEFFNKVEAKQSSAHPIALLQEEKLLRELLVDAGVIVRIQTANNNGEARYAVNPKKPYAAIASYARSDRHALQRTLLFHELLHTVYFRDEHLRSMVDSIWQSLSALHKQLWHEFLYHNGYDASYSYLVKNELYAYLLQRPLEDLAWYVPARIIPETDTVLNAKEALAFTNALIDKAKILSTYMIKHYRIRDGNVEYIKME